jgi:hypothetical protein
MKATTDLEEHITQRYKATDKKPKPPSKEPKIQSFMYFPAYLIPYIRKIRVKYCDLSPKI